MPILPDGTIVVPQQQYVTRVLLEFTYEAAFVAEAQETHNRLIDTVSDGVHQIDTLMDLLGHSVDINIGYAKNPQSLPEGEGEAGGSVNGS